MDIENREDYSGKTVDLFSAAVILFLMLFRRPPWTAARLSQVPEYKNNFALVGDFSKFW